MLGVKVGFPSVAWMEYFILEPLIVSAESDPGKNDKMS